MNLVDNVLFRLPKDRELQFPAMSVLQSFVNNFQSKMKVANTTGDKEATFELHYDVDAQPGTMEFFKSVGLELNQWPKNVESFDAMFDLTDDRAEMFKGSYKHVVQIFGVITGVHASPVPMLKIVQPRQRGMVWLNVGEIDVLKDCGVRYIQSTGTELLQVQDYQWTGVAGTACWETYLAAAMGLPVIELLPTGRPSFWLSKWTNKGYRVITGEKDINRQVRSALDSINQMLVDLVTRARHDSIRRQFGAS